MTLLEEAVVLEAEDQQMLAFLTRSADPPKHDLAVVLCPRFGWEDLTSYRARWQWAHRLAHEGIPTARFDLPGAGDSAEASKPSGLLESWVTGTAAVAAWMRERSSVGRIALIGTGLGGLLAWEAIAGGAGGAELLVLWGVPPNGRRLMREMRAYADIIAARYPDDVRQPLGAQASDPLNLVGYPMAAELAGELERLAPAEHPPLRPPADVLLIARDGLKPPEAQRAYFERAGSRVALMEAEDHGTLLSEPQQAKFPRDTIEATTAWLIRVAGAADPRSRSTPEVRKGSAPARERRALVVQHEGRSVEERPVRLAVDGYDIFGVITRPVDEPEASVTAVLPSAGALRHTGPNRAWVELARRWALRGVSTFRFDLPGIGDSDGEAAALVPNRALYAPESTQRVVAALDHLAELGLPDRFLVAGLCSGAYWALHSALRDERVTAIGMLNLYAFSWSEELVAERGTTKALRSLSGRGVRRLLRRDVSAEELRERLQGLGPRRLRERSGHPIEEKQRPLIRDALERLRERDVQALLLLSREEPLVAQLTRQGFLSELDRWPNLRLQELPSRDHMFRALWLQEQVHHALDGLLERTLNAKLVATDD